LANKELSFVIKKGLSVTKRPLFVNQEHSLRIESLYAFTRLKRSRRFSGRRLIKVFCWQASFGLLQICKSKCQVRALKPMMLNSTNVVRGKTEKRSRAFTLTDLVAVIATMAILLVVLLPARASLGHKAGTLECKSNLRQVGAAIQMFANDHTNRLPGPSWQGLYWSTAGDWGNSIGSYIAPYLGLITNGTVRELEQLKCPAAMQAQPNLTPGGTLNRPIYFLSSLIITNKPGAVYMGYPTPDIFAYPFGRPNTPTVQPTNMTVIKRPSESWMLVDADRRNALSGSTYYNYLPSDSVHNNRPGGSRGGTLRNYLYFDGGVWPVLTPN